MMKKIFFVILAVLLSSEGNSQLWKMRRFELTVSPGSTHFSGDIGVAKEGNSRYSFGDLLFRQTGFNINTNLRYRIINNFSARANFTFGSFSSTDKSSFTRSYKSTSRFFEPAILGEYYFIRNKGEDSYSTKGKKGNSFFSRIDAYIYAGLGGIFYDVRPNEALAPIVTKPDGVAAIIPVGLGAGFFLSSDWNIGLEIGGRYSTSDYIDGFSTYALSADDSYYLVNMTFTRKINFRKI